MKKKRVYVVPHSHWDREWYFSIEDSNILLSENLDHLLNVLERDESYTAYVFDGQSSIVEEYIKVRPENKERLQKLIQAKRLFVGPWYTQTDSLLVHKESVIRNLLYGTKIAKEMGHSMEIGYLPDIFGQNAYLPSIFRGFGIQFSILQRGIYTDQLHGDVNFIWKSPDGQSVKANHIYLGYGPGKFLSSDREYVQKQLLPMIEKLEEMNKHCDHLLLPAGGDQVLIREHFPKTVAELNGIDPDREYVLSDYETFMKETWADESFHNVIEGELLATEQSRIHHTIRSQRYDIKQMNAIVEHKLLHVLEPLAVIGQTLGLNYPKAWLDQMWKQLFDVHAHDSIGGCNSDETNEAILFRLKKINRMADSLMNVVKKQIARAISNKLGKENIYVFFHTQPRTFSGVVKGVVFTKNPHFQIMTTDGKPVQAEMIAQRHLSGGKKIVVTAEGEKEVALPGYYRTEIQLHVKNVPPLGYCTYEIIEGQTDLEKRVRVEEKWIENDYFAVSYEQGTLMLTDKRSGETIRHFFRLENTGDAGDSYDYSPLEGDEPIYLEKAKLLSVEKGCLTETMVVQHTAKTPANLTERKANVKSSELTVVTTFELRKGEAFVRVRHEVENKMEDHRLRVLLKTPVANPKTSFADQGFSLVERSVDNPYLANWRERNFAEAPVPIYPLENVAGVHDDRFVFAVITKGIKEYEVLSETEEFALTLFRSVGLLGRDDLLWRPGRASGINNQVVYTPDAQLKKKLDFEYAIYAAKEKRDPKRIFALIDAYRGHFASYQLQTLNTLEERLDRFEIPYPIERAPEQFSLLEIDNDAIFMSVCKQAYDDSAIIVRLFNPTSEPQTFTVKSPYVLSIVETNLAEEEICEVTESCRIDAKGYITLKLKVMRDNEKM
ncbi:glycoside hydrolase family 38 C-terminal domain-containing protein [Parageobacillus thermoglucosidasius]|uniref:Alpha-mannosidase n=1 Tax=Parageobacillus thermoglucosidasius TaxID=1426 RepID=A0A1B7KNI0_PARTM|nr:glycoside hydrolase family 38 C-terminal domain-containing protein [Parageobacillus thermoglucosidasius]OAT71644.1 alpha-mannosidase [Parageobacillus thermoglucosidasius]